MVDFNACSGKSENVHFDVLLDVNNVSAKKVQKSYLMTLKSDSNFEEKLTFCLENDRNLMSFNSSSGKSENLHFEGIFLSKVCNAWDKIIQRSCVVKIDL